MSIGFSRRRALLCASMLAIACGPDRTTGPDGGPESLAHATPTGVSASPGPAISVDLSWQDRSTDESGFEVHRSSTGADGTFLLVATVPANSTSFPDAERAPLTAYCYRVRAVRTDGGSPTYSPFSSTACATTFDRPAPSSSVRVVPEGFGSVLVYWAADSAAERYHVERSASAAGPWESRGEVWGEELIDRNREDEQQVCYRVTSRGPNGEAAASPVCTTPPAPPAGMSATSRSTGGIGLTWTDRSAVEDGYQIQRATGSRYGFATIAEVPADAVSYNDATASSNVRHWYRVRAKKDAGYSAPADEAVALHSTVVPDAPSNVSVLPRSSTTIYLEWMDVSGNSTGFIVERSTNGGAWMLAGDRAWDRQMLHAAWLTPDEEVCYRVRAVNDVGYSPHSAGACTAPPRAPTNLVATPAERGTIALTWRDESSVEDGYAVQRVFCFDGDWGYECIGTTIGTVGPGITSFRMTGLTQGVVDTYQVVAFRTRGAERGYSDASNHVSAAAPPD